MTLSPLGVLKDGYYKMDRGRLETIPIVCFQKQYIFVLHTRADWNLRETCQQTKELIAY